MKCIKRGEEIKRVGDQEANQAVKNGWSFCPKAEWKALKKQNESAKK